MANSPRYSSFISPITLLSHGVSGVNVTAKLKLSSVDDTTESMKIKFCTWSSAMPQLSQLRNFQRLSFHLSRQSNQIKAMVNYTTQGLWGKSLINRGCLRKVFWLSGVIDTAESTLSSKIPVNWKLHAKSLCVKTVAQGKMFDGKNKGGKSRETVPLKVIKFSFALLEKYYLPDFIDCPGALKLRSHRLKRWFTKPAVFVTKEFLKAVTGPLNRFPKYAETSWQNMQNFLSSVIFGNL